MARRGEIIDGKYEILREIGHGGMSVVYLAQDTRLNKNWAVKEFRKDQDNESRQLALKALLNEAELMKKLDHPTLPRIVDIIENKQTAYIIMDYIEGEPLNKVLDAYGAQPQEAVIEWGKQLSEVLDYLHTRKPPVIYRDMKPGNIMLKPDGTVRLFDFGIAREYKEGKKGDTTNVGTRGYAPPEMFQNEGQSDARSDIYSLGVTLYHLVTGKDPAEPPYELYPIRHWNSALSGGLEYLIQKCVQLNPKDRWQSCAEVTYVLENLQKFDYEYKKKLKNKVNLFTTFSVLSAVFLFVGTGLLLGGSQMKTQNYNNWISQGTLYAYEQAILIDEENPEAYEKMLPLLRQMDVIKIGARETGDSDAEKESGQDAQFNGSGGVMRYVTGKEIYQQELGQCFSEERLRILKAQSPSTYVKVNYELGRLYWNRYEGTALQAATEAEKYFSAVITTVNEDPQSNQLTAEQYNLARAYYLVSYFQNNKKDMRLLDDGLFHASDAAKAVGVSGIDESGNIENPFHAFYQANMDLLVLLQPNTAKENPADGSDISNTVKMETLERMVYILQENFSDFKESGKVSAEEMQSLYKGLKAAISAIDENEQNTARKAEALKNLEKIKPSIEQKYKIDLNA